MVVVSAYDPDDMAIERGSLVLADITGYTKYLTGVELDHAHDILADLISVVVRELTGPLELAKLEGDAVFCFQRDAAGRVEGLTLLTLVETCSFAFRERLRTIEKLTSCPCNACILIPGLALKFVVHHGQFILQDVVGNRELLGPDVVIVHRLLKNRVTDETGLGGYALFTEGCVARFGLDVEALGLRPHLEAYEDVGPVDGFVHDLDARWRAEQERRVVYVVPGEGWVEEETEIDADPDVLWEWLTSPVKRAQWQPGTLRVDQELAGGATRGRHGESLRPRRLDHQRRDP
jgi:hypothetical protein